MGIRTARLSFTLIGSLIAFLLQVILAPNIAIYDVVPNFILIFVVVNAMFSTEIRSLLTGFTLGVFYDFVAQGALGEMSFVLTLLGYGVSSLNKELFEGSWTIQAIFLLIAALIGELLHAAILSILGYDSDFILSLGMRVIPGAIYNALFGLMIFPLMARLGRTRKKDPGIIKSKLG